MEPNHYKHIHGWSPFLPLYKQVYEEAKDGAVFVELGSWLGRSAIYMGELIKYGSKDIKFFAVDHFKGGHDLTAQYSRLPRPQLDLFLDNVSWAMVDKQITVIESESFEGAAAFKDASVDFLFVDAGHDYELVKADIHTWLPKMKPGSLLAGDDYGQWPGVAQAVDEFVKERNLKLELGHGPTWWIRLP